MESNIFNKSNQQLDKSQNTFDKPLKPIRVFAVDDSPSILKLLSKIFEKDPEFNLVGTAVNGLDAEKKVQDLEFDVMTLDIHMPEMTGVEYLRKNFSPNHSKVLMISSASQEDTTYSQEALRLGASDFVEKPSLNNLKKRAEEIKNKIKMIVNDDSPTSQHSPTTNKSNTIKPLIDEQFKNKFLIKKPEMKCRVFFATSFDFYKLETIVSSLKGQQPPIIIFLNRDGISEFKKRPSSSMNLVDWTQGDPLEVNKVYIATIEEDFHKLKYKLKSMSASFSIFSKVLFDRDIDEYCLNKTQILLEDRANINQELLSKATDLFPWTSFAHIGTEYLAND